MISKLEKKAIAFPYKKLQFKNKNEIKCKLKLTHMHMMLYLNSLIYHCQDISAEFLTKSDREYVADSSNQEEFAFMTFFSHIATHYFYPCMLQSIYKQYNPLMSTTISSISYEIFEILYKTIDLLLSCKKINMARSLFKIDYIWDSKLHKVTEASSQIDKYRYSFFNFINYMTLINLEATKDFYKANNNAVPTYISTPLLKNQVNYLKMTLGLTFQMCISQASLLSANSDIFNESKFQVPTAIKDSSLNKLKNPDFLNFFPLYKILEYFEQVLFNSEIEGLEYLKLSISFELLTLIENAESKDLADKLIFYFKPSSLFVEAEKSLVAAYNLVNNIKYEPINNNNNDNNIIYGKKNNEVSKGSTNIQNKVDYSDLCDIISSTPDKLNTYYTTKQFLLYINYMKLASYIGNLYDESLKKKDSFANDFVFGSAEKKEELKDRDKMKTSLSENKINYGYSDEDDNLAVFYAHCLYRLFERKVEYYYEGRLKLKIFIPSTKGFIICYHKQKITGLINLKRATTSPEELLEELELDNKKIENDKFIDKDEDFKFEEPTEVEEVVDVVKEKDSEYTEETITKYKDQDNKIPIQLNGEDEEKQILVNTFSMESLAQNMTVGNYIPPNLAIRLKEQNIPQNTQVRCPIKITSEIPLIFNMKIFEKNLNQLCHPDRLVKFSETLWKFFSEFSYERSSSLATNPRIQEMQSNLVQGQEYAYYISVLIIIYFFFFISDIFNLTTIEYGIFYFLSIGQILCIGTNLYFFVGNFLKENDKLIVGTEKILFGKIEIKQLYIHLLDECITSLILLTLNLLSIVLKYKLVFICSQLFFIYLFSAAIRSIYYAFLSKLNELLSLMLILIICIVTFATFAFYFYNPEFNVLPSATPSSDVDASVVTGIQFTKNSFLAYLEQTNNADNSTNICNSLLSCILFFFNFGVRAGGGIGDKLEVKTIDQQFYWTRFFFDMIFYILTILLLLNMLNGIIINGFTTYREKMDDIQEVKMNNCFICNLNRKTFDKRKLNYYDHIKYDHNPYNYFLFFERLKSKKLSKEEKNLVSCLRNGEISLYPVNTGLLFSKGLETVTKKIENDIYHSHYKPNTESSESLQDSNSVNEN